MQNFSYVVGDEKTKEAAIVDPGWEVDKLLSVAEKHGFRVTAIILTHGHWDHVQALEEAVAKTDGMIYVHENETIDLSNYQRVTTLKDGDTFSVGNVRFSVMHTPGHTPGGMCVRVDNKLITGDTLFVEGCGRVDMPGCDPDKMWDSLQKLKALDEDIEVYPGHDYGSKKHSTIGYEKKHNRFLILSTKQEFFGERL